MAKVPDAGFLAPVVARLEKIEGAVEDNLLPLCKRLESDYYDMKESVDAIIKQLAMLRGAVEGKE